MVNSHSAQNALTLAKLNACETPFLHELTHSAQYSEHTIAAYARDVGQFLGWLNADMAENDTLTLDYALFADYFSAKQFAEKTTRRKLVSLSKFCQYLIAQGLMTQDPTKELTPPKLPKRLPNALPPDDLAALLDNLANSVDKSNAIAVRDWAIVELLYSTGARVAELAGIDLSDIDLSERQIRVIGKGDKERIVHIGEKAMIALNHWLSSRQHWQTPTCQALFINRRGTRLTIRSIQLRLKTMGLAFDANLNLHPHRLRHSFGGHIVQSGGDLRAVQEMLGHSSLAATQIYTHLDFQALAKVYDQAHPHAKRERSNNDSEQSIDNKNGGD